MDFLPFLLLFVIYVFIFCVFVLCIVCVIILLKTENYPIVEHFEGEDSFYNPKTDLREKFPSISDKQIVDLSVIVPAYNEAERLPPMLDEALGFLEERSKELPKYKYEIIVVSDGSTDGTVALTEKYSQKYGTDKVRCLKLMRNRGKGGAVRLGVQRARGSLILFADADGASKFGDIQKLELALKNIVKQSEPADSLGVVIGSRSHLEEQSLAKRSFLRNVLMYGFHFMVWLFTVKGIRDTQCGFKLFTRKAANICFQSLHVNGWAFDAELLYIAQKLKIPIEEKAIVWTEIDGSKVTPVLSWIQMGIDLCLIWLKYTLGAWKIKGQNLIKTE